jgi:hypothetical protein
MGAGFIFGVIGLVVAGAVVSGSGDELKRYVTGALCGGIGLLLVLGTGFGIFYQVKKSLQEMEVIAVNLGGQPLLYGRGAYKKGMTTGSGVLICRPGFVTFLVLGKLHNPLGDLTDAVVSNVTGYQKTTISDPSQIMNWIETLRTKHAGRFDELVLNGAAERGAITWPVTEMTAEYDTTTQKPKKWFTCRSGKAIIEFMKKLHDEQQTVAEEMVVAMERERTNPSPPPEPSIFLGE